MFSPALSFEDTRVSLPLTITSQQLRRSKEIPFLLAYKN